MKGGESKVEGKSKGRKGKEKEFKRGIILKINWIIAVTSSGFPLNNNKMKCYLYLYTTKKKIHTVYLTTFA